MWTTIYMSQKEEETIRIKSLLEAKGIITKSKCVRNETEEECYYEILVPSKEVAEAHSLIIDEEI